MTREIFLSEYEVFAKSDPCCDEIHPSDGKRPVRDDPKGGSGRQDTGHGKRSIEHDGRGRRGHGGHKDPHKRPTNER